VHLRLVEWAPFHAERTGAITDTYATFVFEKLESEKLESENDVSGARAETRRAATAPQTMTPRHNTDGGRPARRGAVFEADARKRRRGGVVE
jgi:hypothetical protein